MLIAVATAGLGTAIAGALGGGMLGGILGGAIGGAVTGAITGAIVGASISLVSQGLTNGYGNVSWSNVGLSALEGCISGAISGAQRELDLRLRRGTQDKVGLVIKI